MKRHCLPLSVLPLKNLHHGKILLRFDKLFMLFFVFKI